MELYVSSGPELLSNLLRSARRTYTGEPESDTGHESTRYRPPGLSQAAVARRMSIGLNAISEWENGRRRVPRFRLDELAAAYAMTPEQRDELWLIVTGRYPPEGPARPAAEVVTGWTLYVRGLQAPAFVTDAAWNVVESNRHWRDLFEPAGQPVPDNLLRFLLTNPYARRLCADWRSGWAVPFLRELRLDAQSSNDSELHAVLRELREDPALAGLWRASGESVRTALHDDTQERTLRPPRTGQRRSVRLLVFSPAHDQGRRVFTILPSPSPAVVLPVILPFELPTAIAA
jgi:transcriptional regulator with XRE-family HTH domain